MFFAKDIAFFKKIVYNVVERERGFTMKKRISACFVLLILFASLLTTPVSAVSLPDISAESYVVINADSCRTILSKEENKVFQPAEQIVVFALLAAIKNGDLNQPITVPQDLPPANNSLELKSGDVFLLKDYIEMTALNSSVQSLYCIASGVFHSSDAMVKAMQEIADALGCQHTKINSLDFGDPKNQTSVSDLVRAGRAYMQEDLLSSLFKVVAREFVAQHGDATPFLVYSTNSLVSNYRHSTYLYNKAYGIKEAYHPAEKEYHLLTSAKSGDKNILVAVAKVPEVADNLTAYTDIQALSEYVFEHYVSTTLVKADEPISERSVENTAQGTHIILKAADAQTALLPADLDPEDVEKKVTCREPIKAPVKKGDILGKVEFYFQGNKIAESDLYCDRTVSFRPTVSLAGGVFRFLSHPLTIVIIVLLVLIFVILLLRQFYLANQKAKKRRRNRKK